MQHTCSATVAYQKHIHSDMLEVFEVLMLHMQLDIPTCSASVFPLSLSDDAIFHPHFISPFRFEFAYLCTSSFFHSRQFPTPQPEPLSLS